MTAETSRPDAAIDNLTHHQEQCDMDGVMVKVSRQALDEVLAHLRGVAQAPTEAREKEITRLATIEECAALCENAGNHEFTNFHRVLAARIRALALPSTHREADVAQVDAAREFVKRHPALTLIDLAEFEAFLKVPAMVDAALSSTNLGSHATGTPSREPTGEYTITPAERSGGAQ